MRLNKNAIVAAFAAGASATSLTKVCTVAHVNSVLPSNGTLLGINVLPSFSTANTVYNAGSSAGMGATASSSKPIITAT